MNHVIQRWWEAWNLIPWPDDLAMKLNILFPSCAGREDECMHIKQAIMRYANLSIIETFRMISSPVKKRFPMYQRMVDAGLITDTEMNIMKSALVRSEVSDTGYWLPLNWAGNLLVKAGQEKMISGRYVSDIVDEINKIRGRNGALILFGWVNVPIKFTQVVTIAVYVFVFTALFGRQSLDISDDKKISGYQNVDGIFNVAPFYLALEFLLYFGWLKASEALINPFGDDDDDFEMNYIIDRNLVICYLYFGGVRPHFLDVENGPYWNLTIPKEMWHTIGAALPLFTPSVYSVAGNLPVSFDQHKVVSIKNISYLMKPDSIGTASSRSHSALGFNSVVKCVANRVIKGNQKVSDSKCFSSADSKTNISIISAPNLQETSSMFTVRNQNKVASKKNVVNRISTLV